MKSETQRSNLLNGTLQGAQHQHLSSFPLGRLKASRGAKTRGNVERVTAGLRTRSPLKCDTCQLVCFSGCLLHPYKQDKVWPLDEESTRAKSNVETRRPPSVKEIRFLGVFLVVVTVSVNPLSRPHHRYSCDQKHSYMRQELGMAKPSDWTRDQSRFSSESNHDPLYGQLS